jgi:hypothetical protein
VSEKDDIEASLSPTEELITEVLIARHRLGEPFWPIAKRNQKAIDSLGEKGLVNDYGHNSPGTVRVALTLKAKALWARPLTYVPPIFRDDLVKRNQWRQLQTLLFDE